jgi:DNA-binding NarL/FixJ family response regulator
LPRFGFFSVDDHPLLREGIASVINAQPDMHVVAQVSTGREAIEHFRKYRPDVTLLDLRLPDVNGIDAMIAIRSEFPEARIVMLSTFEADVEIERALPAGARSYLVKSMPPRDMLETIRHAGKKRIPAEVAARLAEHLSEEALSEREVELLQLVVTGNRNSEIANRLSISEETVKAHLKHMGKLGATARTQAITIALRRGIVQL